MRILAIGNSFSQDATRYLHDVAKVDGSKFEVVNLYIGGCSLEKHYRNMLGDHRVYDLQYNGSQTGFQISIKEALLSRAWDVVTLQQASHQSPYYKSYQPYLDELNAYVRRCVPQARVLIHQTWAYEEGSERFRQIPEPMTSAEMLEKIKENYDRAVREIGADGMIRSGELMAKLLENGIARVHRDGFHASLGLGRYALALLWYATLSGRTIEDNAFTDFDVEVSDEEIAIAKKCVSDLCNA